MRTWVGLVREIDRLDVGERRAAETRAQFETWARIAETDAIAGIHAEALHRARDIEGSTGLVIRVEQPLETRPHAEGPTFRALSLHLGGSRVDVYSTREPAQSPSIHFGALRLATSTRFPVLATVPGALVVRAQDGGYALLALPFPPGHEPRPKTTLDALTLRAFELLVGTHRSTLARQ